MNAHRPKRRRFAAIQNGLCFLHSALYLTQFLYKINLFSVSVCIHINLIFVHKSNNWTCCTESGQYNQQDPCLNTKFQDKYFTAMVQRQGIIYAHHYEMIPMIGCLVEGLGTAFNDESFNSSCLVLVACVRYRICF